MKNSKLLSIFVALISISGVSSVAKSQGFYESAEIAYLGSTHLQSIPGESYRPITNYGTSVILFTGFGPRTIGVVPATDVMRVNMAPNFVTGERVSMNVRIPVSTQNLVDAYYIDVGTTFDPNGYPQGNLVSRFIDASGPTDDYMSYNQVIVVPDVPRFHVRIWTHFRGGDWQSKFYLISR